MIAEVKVTGHRMNRDFEVISSLSVPHFLPIYVYRERYKKSISIKIQAQRDIIGWKVVTLHAADPSSISNALYGSLRIVVGLL